MGETRTNLVQSASNLRVLSNYRRLRYIRRTNNLPTIQTEDVAQHSFYVAVLATTLAEDYNQSVAQHNADFHPLDMENTYDIVDVKAVTSQALFHDMEEAFTSDIPWNVKHHSEKTRLAIRQCVQDKLEVAFFGTDGPVSAQQALILRAKDGLPGKFVNAADNLEGAWYCYTELEMGNKYLESLFCKYLMVIRDDPFTPVLQKFSPLFNKIMDAFCEVESLIHKSDSPAWDKMILD